ncbi:hypothetical protein FGD67_06265 [Colwellia sp. M166]|uniref:hypothetical protein n=1 Tax=Colwellia sp. M166 TaxID=2583805 RepID=UPI00211E6900|nr:hypothetical protein [Colwellia sp. M166]UUO22835.1 hypothetical protein FGD67_06265 [Colwellia sp. M166]
MSDKNPSEWHLKKEVNLTHIISTAIVTISGFWFISGIDKRVDLNSVEILHLQKIREEDQTRSMKQFDKINAKLDRLLESK